MTGVTGQDGSHLADLLIEKGYQVHGIIRRASTFITRRIDHLYKDPHEPDARMLPHYGDLTDGSQIARAIASIRPDEFYNLGTQSHVAVSQAVAKTSWLCSTTANTNHPSYSSLLACQVSPKTRVR